MFLSNCLNGFNRYQGTVYLTRDVRRKTHTSVSGSRLPGTTPFHPPVPLKFQLRNRPVRSTDGTGLEGK